MGHDSIRNFDVAMDLIDFYIKHYEKLGHRGTARKFKELREDIENALVIKNNDEEYITLVRKLGDGGNAVLMRHDGSIFKKSDIGKPFEFWQVKPIYDKGDNAVCRQGVLIGIEWIDGHFDEAVFDYYGEFQSGYVSREDIENAIAFKEGDHER